MTLRKHEKFMGFFGIFFEYRDLLGSLCQSSISMKFPLYSHHIGVMGTHEPFNLAIKVLTTTSYLATWVKSWKHMESHQKPREIPPKSAFQLLRVSVQKISNVFSWHPNQLAEPSRFKSPQNSNNWVYFKIDGLFMIGLPNSSFQDLRGFQGSEKRFLGPPGLV